MPLILWLQPAGTSRASFENKQGIGIQVFDVASKQSFYSGEIRLIIWRK